MPSRFSAVYWASSHVYWASSHVTHVYWASSHVYPASSHVTHQVVAGAEMLDDLAVVQRPRGHRPQPPVLAGGHRGLSAGSVVTRGRHRGQVITGGRRRLSRRIGGGLEWLRPGQREAWVVSECWQPPQCLTKCARYQVSFYGDKKYETGKKVFWVILRDELTMSTHQRALIHVSDQSESFNPCEWAWAMRGRC